MRYVIIKTVDSNCKFKKAYYESNPDLKTLLDQFAVDFILRHNLEKNNRSISMWLDYRNHEDLRWEILRPFWLNYLKQRNCSKVKWYIFTDKIKKSNFVKKTSNIFFKLKQNPYISRLCVAFYRAFVVYMALWLCAFNPKVLALFLVIFFFSH